MIIYEYSNNKGYHTVLEGLLQGNLCCIMGCKAVRVRL